MHVRESSSLRYCTSRICRLYINPNRPEMEWDVNLVALLDRTVWHTPSTISNETVTVSKTMRFCYALVVQKALSFFLAGVWISLTSDYPSRLSNDNTSFATSKKDKHGSTGTVLGPLRQIM